MRKLAVLVLIVVGGIVAWRHFRDEAPPPAPPATEKAVAAKPVSLPVTAVLDVRPSATAPSAALAAVLSKPAPLASKDMAQFRARSNYAELYARLKAGPQTPEALYLQAAIYSRCVGANFGPTPPKTAAERATDRERFVAQASEGNGDPAPRLAAYDKLASPSPCEGLDLGKFDKATFERMLADAVAAGDPRAQAWQLADRIDGSKYDDQGRRFSNEHKMAPEDMAQVQRLLATGDPDVIMDFSGVLASTMANGLIELDGNPIDPRAMFSALQLYACDVGAQCGADSTLILSNCAYMGHCDTANLYDYMYYYDLSPSQSQLVDSYRQLFTKMYGNGAFDQLTFHPQPIDNPMSYTFGMPRP